MNKFVVDASAWLEYFDGSPKGEKIKKYFEDAELYTSALCVAEVVARVLRRGASADVARTVINARSVVISVDFDLGAHGGILYATLRKTRAKISLSDAITLAIAKKLSAKILTFDNDFRGIPEAVII